MTKKIGKKKQFLIPLTAELSNGHYMRAKAIGYDFDKGCTLYAVRFYKHGNRKLIHSFECAVKTNMSDTLKKHVDREWRKLLADELTICNHRPCTLWCTRTTRGPGGKLLRECSGAKAVR